MRNVDDVVVVVVEPPWGDDEWGEPMAIAAEGLFTRWPLLAPQLMEWAEKFTLA